MEGGDALAGEPRSPWTLPRRGRSWTRYRTIDFDPTDDPTHGQQEFAFFNGHYDTACYLPLLGFVTFDDEPEQYLVLAP